MDKGRLLELHKEAEAVEADFRSLYQEVSQGVDVPSGSFKEIGNRLEAIARDMTNCQEGVFETRALLRRLWQRTNLRLRGKGVGPLGELDLPEGIQIISLQEIQSV